MHTPMQTKYAAKSGTLAAQWVGRKFFLLDYDRIAAKRMFFKIGVASLLKICQNRCVNEMDLVSQPKKGA